MAKIARLKS